MTEKVEDIVKGSFLGAEEIPLEDGRGFQTTYRYRVQGEERTCVVYSKKGTGILDSRAKKGDRLRIQQGEIIIVSFRRQTTLHRYFPNGESTA